MGTHAMTDETGQYAHLSKHFTEHDFVRHSTAEYGRSIVHTNTVEGFYSVFKRGMVGVYQHRSTRYLHRYATEFNFRCNSRIKLGVDDLARADLALQCVAGKRLMYKIPRRREADRPRPKMLADRLRGHGVIADVRQLELGLTEVWDE